MDRLEALALTFLLNALWQVPLVVLAASLGERLLARGPARLRHGLWIAALGACVLLPAASLLPERSPEAVALPAVAGGVDGRGALPGVAGSAAPESQPEAGSLSLPPFVLTGVALLYGASLLLQAGRLGRSWWRARALARTAEPLDLPAEAAAIAERCREAFGLARVDLFASDRIPGPLTLGALRPVILLPPELPAAATPEELIACLGHEMAHVRRRDYALHLLGEALLVPLSLHPAVRRLRQRLAETREMACDEATVERLIGARAYARSLLSLAASIAGLPRPVFTLGVHQPDTADTLEVRMKRLTDSRSRLSARLALASLSLALLLLAGTGLGAASMALNAPVAATQDAASWKPFLGLWQGGFPDKDGHKLPGSDLEIRLTNGRPEAILTLYRYKKNEDGSLRTDTFDVPAYDLSVDGQALTFHFRTALQYRPGDRKEILEHTSRLELTGEGEAILRPLGGKSSADPSKIPPPPPPHPMKRAR